MEVATQYQDVPISLRSLFRILLYCSLLICATAVHAQVDSQRTLQSAREDQDYTFALGLYSDKMYELAAEQLDAFVRSYPLSVRRPDALFLRSECAYFMSEYDVAASGYRAFLVEYPRSGLADDAQFRIGQSELARNRYEGSVAAFKSVIDDHPDSPLAGESAYWLGEAYDRSGDMSNAVKYFTLSYEHFTGNPYKDYAMYAVGWTYHKNSRFAEARQAYENLLSALPGSSLAPAATVRIGECLFAEKKYAEAVSHLTPLLSSVRDTTLQGDAQYTVAESHYALQEYDKAGARFTALIDAYPRHQRYGDALYGLGWTNLKQKKFDAAADAFRRLADLGGVRSHEAAYRFGAALRDAGRQDSARTVLLSVAAGRTDGEYSDDALVDAADISLRAGNKEAAGQIARRVVTEFPASNVRGDALWMLGELALADGKPAEARPFFKAAVVNPVSGREIVVTSSFRAALCSYRTASYDTAAAEFGQFREAYPGHPKVAEAAYWQAESEFRRGNFSQARPLYTEAVRSTSGKQQQDALYGLGWAAYKEGRYQEAVEAFGRLISGAQRSTIDYDARMRQADALFAMKEYQRAEQAYRSAVRLYPDTSANDVARYQAAQCAFRREDLPGAYAQFQDLVKTMPKSPFADDAQYAMGWINFRRKEYADAIKDFQVVIRSFPNGDVVPRAYYSLADGYYNLGQYGPAERSYRDVIKLFPESQYVPDAITGLQYCLIAQGKDDEAVRVIDDFLREHGSSPSAQALQLKKAEILFGKGERTAAREAYRAFVASYPSSPLIGQAWYWLGKTELQSGNREASFDGFRRAWESPGAYRGPALLDALDAAIAIGRTEEALSLILGFERSMTPAEIRADVAYRKAQLYRAEGNEEEAQRQFERVVTDHPSEKAAARARVTLARMAMDKGDMERARLLAQDVAGSSTDDVGAEAQVLVAESYAGQKKWRDAATAFLRVKYVFPSSREWNDEAALGLAGAYRSLGETEKARQTLREFLKGSPDPEVRAKAEALLKELGG